MTADETRCECGHPHHEHAGIAGSGYCMADQPGTTPQSRCYCNTFRAAERAPTPPDAGGTAMTEEQLHAIDEHYRFRSDGDAGVIGRLLDEVTRLRTEATRPTGEEDGDPDTVRDAQLYASRLHRQFELEWGKQDRYIAHLARDLAALRARLDRAEGDTARLNWIEECGQEVSPTFEPRDAAWCVVDRTLEQVKCLHELTTYDATLRGAIDAAMANAHESNAARALSTPTPPTTEPTA